MNKPGIWISVCLLIFILPVPHPFAQEEMAPFTFRLAPGLALPLGEDAEIFDWSFGGDLFLQYRWPSLPLVCVDGSAGYTFLPVKVHPDKEPNSLSVIHGGIGPGLSWDILPKLNLGIHGNLGYYYCFYNKEIPDADPTDTREGNLFFKAGGGLTFHMLPSLSVGLEAFYRNFMGLSQDVMFNLGFSYNIIPRSSVPGQPSPTKSLEIDNVELNTVFPVFYHYYDDHAVGKLVLHNAGKEPLQDVQVSLLVKQYMDDPKPSFAIEQLYPGEEKLVILYGLFTDGVLEITERTKVTAKIIITSRQNDKEYLNEFVETLIIENRNAMTWDDDRKAAAFVTMKDPTVLKFAKNVSSVIKGKGPGALSKSFLLALGLLETLNLYGMSYTIDPSTPYKELSAQDWTVDYLQFPKQTLDYKAGDCDDLSILYSSLLESLGTQTAFITVPGHIYLAFSLGIPPREARALFHDPGRLIFQEENAWVPVEVTALENGFLKAWDTGARTWMEYFAKGEAGFFPLAQCWEIFEPVGFSGKEAEGFTLPGEEEILGVFEQQVARFVEREIFQRETELLEKMRKSPGDKRLGNRLGVLYARFGRNEQARAEFDKVLKQNDYLPALLNAGNLLFLEKNWPAARGYYQRAARIDPDHIKVLLNLARVDYELGDFASSSSAYRAVKVKDPDLAERFSYLELEGEEGLRAHEYEAMSEVMLWEEE